MDNHPAFSCTGIVAGYRRKEVLHGLDFEIPAHSITGLLGPNGAGKSTLLRLLATISTPSAGEIRMGGLNPALRSERNDIRRNLGFLPQNFSVDERMTVQEFVLYCLWMREYPAAQRTEAAEYAIATVGLENSSGTRIKELSGGMRQRAGIAASIAGTPQFIILDEPTAGLDPEQRYEFRQLLSRLRGLDNSPTILLGTHLVEDVASCADQILVLGEGTIRYSGPAHTLTDSGDRSIDALESTYRRLLGGAKSSAHAADTTTLEA
ncbi:MULTISPECIES: ABC transporter ATP-binding protein [unclassified Corynebacterium]|uniref:ABC transporter ATP-binding protein n=1 Tax=unclassified Corynebacterium TaxID=2624378 RepID=UPI0029C9B437|nr:MULTISPECIES: ATP-binding cassette domain-containing protein [unclassified Corynebacterium]WPF66834.1 ATP-binding cassette domain-containing protein [Corynebacterium sp. 22KM0430]WPF69322.1 ATP-binding cassette domain-containing protein [Corynebacterium sp. 21KM1197]